MRPDELVAVGRVGPARGIRGEVFVEPWTDAPDERFVPGAILRTEPAASGPLTVDTASNAGGKQVIRFVGVGDRPAAEALRGVELYVLAAERAPLRDPDEFYDTDLVGLFARTVHGQALAPVAKVLHAGASAYLVIQVGGRDRLIPFVSAVVPEVDLAAGTVTIDPPAGLLEL